MSDESRVLADLLERAAPEPPRPIDVDEIGCLVDSPSRGRSRFGHRRNWVPAVAAAAAVVLVVVAVAFSTRYGSGSAGPVTSPSASVRLPHTPVPTGTVSTGRLRSPGETQGLTGPRLTNPPSGEIVGPWSATVVRPLGSGPMGMIADGGSLVAVVGNSLVRLNPATGAVEARVPYHGPSGVVIGFVAHGVLFTQPAERGTTGVVYVQRFDATSLARLAPLQVRISGPNPSQNSGGDALTASFVVSSASPDGSRLYLGLGTDVAVVDSVTGHVQDRFVDGDLQTDGALSGLAVSPDGSVLYSSYVLGQMQGTVTARDLSTGETLWRLGGWGSVSVFAASGGGVFVGSYGGMGASLGFLTHGGGGGPAPPHGFSLGSGGGGRPMTVTQAGRIWIVGSVNLACANGQTGREVAYASSREDISNIALVGGHAYGVYQSSGRWKDNLLVRLTLPPACRG